MSRFKVFLLWIVFSLCTAAGSRTVYAGPQPSPSVPIPFEKSDNFDRFFEKISDKGHLSILAEGAPLTLSLSEAQRKELNALLTTAGGKWGDIVSASAAAYDYDALQVDALTFLLRKRYTSPRDFPDVTVEEALESIRHIRTVIAPFSPNMSPPSDPSSPLIPFLAQADQKYGSERLKEGIPLREVGTEDQQLLLNIVKYGYAANINSPMRTIQKVANALQDNRARFREFDLHGLGINIIGYEAPLGGNGGMHEFGISHGFDSDIGGTSMTRLDNGTLLVTSSFSTALSKSMENVYRAKVIGHLVDTPAPAAAPSPDSESSHHTTNIAAIIEGWKAAPSNSAKVSFAAHPALGAKSVTVFNEQFLPHEKVLEGIAEIYGLRLQHPTTAEYLLNLPPPYRIHTMGEMGMAVGRLYPEPWLRACRSLSLVKTSERLQSLNERLGKPKQASEEAARAAMASGPSAEATQEAIAHEATARLRQLVEREIRKSPAKVFPMSAMNAEEKKLFLLMWVASDFNHVDRFIHSQPPKCLSNLDNFYVTGEFNLPNGSSKIGLGFRDAQGRIIREAGADVPTPEAYKKAAASQ